MSMSLNNNEARSLRFSSDQISITQYSRPRYPGLKIAFCQENVGTDSENWESTTVSVQLSEEYFLKHFAYSVTVDETNIPQLRNTEKRLRLIYATILIKVPS